MVRKTVARDALGVETTTPKFAVVGGGRSWFRDLLTDHDGDADLGAVTVFGVVLFMCGAAGFDVLYYAREFKPMEFGGGVAALLAGFAAYKVGDRKQTTATFKRTEETEVRQ